MQLAITEKILAEHAKLAEVKPGAKPSAIFETVMRTVKEAGIPGGDGSKRYKPILGIPEPADAWQWYLGTADAVYQNIYSIEKENPARD